MDEKNGGFDVNFINELQDSYRCLICGLALRKPVQVIECGHRFCWHCLNKRKKSSDERHVEFCCPCCPDEKPIDSSQVFPDKGIERTILNLHIKCSNFQKGCLWAEELNQLENHLKNDCQHELVTCKVENCDECVERYQLEEHECNCTVVQNNIFLNLEASLKALSERLSQCESQLKAKEDRLRMYENVMAENNEQRLFLSRKLESTEKRLAFVEEEFGRRIKELERNIAVPPQGYTNTELISMKLDEIPDLPLTSTRQLSDERTSFTETMLPGKPSFCHPQSTKDSIETSNTNKFGTVIPLDERQSVILTEMHSPAYSTIRRNNHKVPPSLNPPLIPPIPTIFQLATNTTKNTGSVEEKVTYDRDFLLKFQTAAICRNKPEDLPDIDVVLSHCHEPVIPVIPGQCTNVTCSVNYGKQPGRRTKKTGVHNIRKSQSLSDLGPV